MNVVEFKSSIELAADKKLENEVKSIVNDVMHELVACVLSGEFVPLIDDDPEPFDESKLKFTEIA